MLKSNLCSSTKKSEHDLTKRDYRMTYNEIRLLSCASTFGRAELESFSIENSSALGFVPI